MVTNGASAAVGWRPALYSTRATWCWWKRPPFRGVLSVFKRAGADLRNLPMGEDGIDVAAKRLIGRLLAEGARPRMIYTIPTFQNPSGADPARRGARACLTWHISII